MKTAIHPKYYSAAQVVCSCGNMFTVGSTKQSIHVELCNKCHPFFTGKQKFIDTASRIDKFQKKQELAKLQKVEKKKKEETKQEEGPRTLKEMLQALKKG